MTIKELIRKMEMTEEERERKQEEHNGVFGALDHCYKTLCKGWSINEVNKNIQMIRYILYGLLGGHFINRSEFTQLEEELDKLYGMHREKLFDSKKGESL